MRKILVWLCLAVVASVGVTATTCYFVMDNQNTEQSQPTIEPVEQVVAIYELDGEIWKLEIKDKGAEITLPKMEHTLTQKFDGWQIKDMAGTFNDKYTITEDTTFTAVFSDKLNVKFMVNDEIYDNQYYLENEAVTLPEDPIKEGYNFLGWSLNGVDLTPSINTSGVKKNIVYYAIFVEMPDDWTPMYYAGFLTSMEIMFGQMETTTIIPNRQAQRIINMF